MTGGEPIAYNAKFNQINLYTNLWQLRSDIYLIYVYDQLRVSQITDELFIKQNWTAISAYKKVLQLTVKTYVPRP